MKIKNPLKVLIIDDEWLIRAELERMLSSFNEFEVVAEASNALEAIDLLKVVQPDLIFLDICMPGLSGFDMLEKVDINFDIIFISGYGDRLHQAGNYNAIDYLQKPVKQERLTKAIKKFLQKRAKSIVTQKET